MIHEYYSIASVPPGLDKRTSYSNKLKTRNLLDIIHHHKHTYGCWMLDTTEGVLEIEIGAHQRVIGAEASVACGATPSSRLSSSSPVEQDDTSNLHHYFVS
jgi:hypothetical protein